MGVTLYGDHVSLPGGVGVFQPTAGAESCMYRGRVHLGACEFLCGTLHTCWGCLRPCSVPTPANWC